MRLGPTILVALMLVVENASLSVKNAIGQTRLGLHVTQEELNIWKQRAASGPYKSAGDVSTNSPGDWMRIQNNANSFISNPSNERWSGQPSGSCWSWKSNPPELPARNWGERMRDAGFVYLLTGTTSYRDAVLNELLAQSNTAGTNWADSTRWNVGSGCMFGDSYSWQISMWLSKLIYAYDYIRNSISSGDRTTLDTWFTNAANLFNQNTHNQIASRFPNRDADDYTTWGSGYPVCLTPYLTHYNGFTHCDFSEGWNNRASNHIRVVALVGIMTNNTTLKNRAKRWVKEWVRFNNFADSTNGEFHRSVYDSPGVGWNYAALAINAMITIADTFARAGDQELYNYITSLGSPDGGLVPAGGPKSLLSITKKWLDYLDHTTVRYGTISGSQLDSGHIIDSIDEAPFAAQAWVSDTFVARGNLFWKDARIKSVYLRQATNAPAYPSNPSSFGGCVYCGDWSTLPGVLFMYGQMEGQVNPYGGTTTTPPILSSGVTVDSTYPGYTTLPIDDGVIDARGGTATTWASAESPTADHWINIALSSAQQINTATVYWAYNNNQQKYMTSQQVQVQYWNGSSYVTVATMTYPGSDVPSSTVSFSAVTTSQLRFYQPANQGNPTYPTVFWISEVDYGYQTPLVAPSGLHVFADP